MKSALIARARAAITPEVAAAFQRDGAVCLRQLLTPAEVALLARGIDANLAQPSPRAIVARRNSGPGRVFSVRLLGDDMRHARRNWTTSPPFPGLADELPAGAELNHPLFPLLVGAE